MVIQAVFVYGTLKRGQCRAPLWPATPISVEQAWTRGILFGRSDYPAMMAGDDRVLGELWRFSPGDIDRVLQSLDIIEGTNQPDRPDTYVRATVETWNLDDEALEPAFTYHYAIDPTTDRFVRLQPANDGFVRWPD